MSDSNIISIREKDTCKQFEVAVSSIIGNRKEQQDFAGVVMEKDKAMAVVCDGMGGLNGGAEASSSAVKLLVSDYQEEKPETSFSEFLCREAVQIDQYVFMKTDKKGNPLHAGCTMAAVILAGGMLNWISVGDSRIYVLRGDTMLPITRDHNYRRELEEALERKEITQEYFDNEISTRRSDALTSYLGMGGIRRIERNIQPLELMDGDMILLCSDGLYKRLDEDQVKAMLVDNRISPQVTVNRMNRMVMEQTVKGQDNTTIILIHYHAEV